jgi:hypothetical protein
LICVVALLALGACASARDPEGSTAYYLGLVKVVSRGDPKKGSIETVTVVGAWADPKTSFGLGYRKRRQIMLPPDCRIVFIVRSDEELDRLLRAFGPTATGEDKPCTVREQEH